MTSASDMLADFQPPSRQDFGYHEALHCQVGVLSKDFKFALYDFQNGEGVVVFTMLVTDCKGEKIQKIKKACMKSSVLCPLDMIQYKGKDDKPLMALIYLPFKTLRAHLMRSDDTIQDPKFAGVLKGIIRGLNNLQKYKNVYEINEDTLVVKEDCTGSILLISCKGKDDGVKETADEVCCEEFKKVKDIIVDLFPDTGQVVSPNDLETVLQCMGLVKTKFHCRRLLLAPFFFNARGKVLVYIPRIYSAINCCQEYMDALKKITLHKDTYRLVENSKFDDLKEAWKKGEQTKILNYYDVLRFLRNMVAHINDRWNEEYYRGASPLLTYPWMLVNWIKANFSKDVLDLSFLKTFPNPSDPKAKEDGSIGKIPIVDVDFRLWATSQHVGDNADESS